MTTGSSQAVMALDPAAEAASTFQELVSHEGFVRSLARKLVHDEHLADDVLQDTYLAALCRPPKKSAPLKAWLARVIKNRAIQSHRRRAHREVRELAHARKEALPSAAEQCEKDSVRSHLARAILDMDEPYRTAILLRFYEGLEPREMAVRLRVPVETARTRVKRGVDKLRARLDREYGDRSAWCTLFVSTFGNLRGPLLAARPTSAITRLAAGLAVLVAAAALVLWIIPRLSDEANAVTIGARSVASAATTSPAAIEAERSPAPARAPSSRAATAPVAVASTLEGRTFDEHGAALAGVELEAWRWKNTWNESGELEIVARAVSDARGSFMLAELPARFVVDARAGARIATEQLVGDLDRARGLNGVALVLVEPALLAGRAIDEDGVPVEGALVRAERSRGDADFRPTRHGGLWYAARAGVSTRTRSDGTFELDGLPDGRFKLSAKKRGHMPFGCTSWPRDEAIELVLAHGVDVEILVTDASGVPVPEASVQVRHDGIAEIGFDPATQRLKTDTAGRVQVESVQPGVLALARVQAPGFAVAYVGPFAFDAAVRQRAHLDAGHAIRGVAVDADNTPVAGARVLARAVPPRTVYEAVSAGPHSALFDLAEAQTDEQGAFVLQNVPRTEIEIRVEPSASSLSVFAQRFAPEIEDVRIVGGRVRGQIAFEGRLRDGRSLAPVERYTVTALCEDSEHPGLAVSAHVDDPHGRFQLGVPEPGDWTLVFQADGFVRSLAAIKDAVPGTNSVDALALPERMLEVRVVDKNGRPVPSATLIISDGDGRPLPMLVKNGAARSVVLVGALGDAVLRELPATRVRVEVMTPLVREPVAFDFELSVPDEGEHVLVMPDLDLSLPRRPVALRVAESDSAAELSSLRIAERDEAVVETSFAGPADVRVLDAEGRVLLSIAGTFDEGRFYSAPHRKSLNLAFDADGAPLGAWRSEIRPNWGAAHGRGFFGSVDPIESLPFPAASCWIEFQSEGRLPLRVELPAFRSGEVQRTLCVQLAHPNR